MKDAQIEKILREAKTIAVVGLSDDPAKASHGVGLYLVSQGYEVIPVNPNAVEVLGRKSYPDVPSIGRPVDVVDIFRPSEAVPPIVAQAIAAGAKVVWMQQGIFHAEAERQAKAAGLQVVMDRCMMKEHYRLVGASLDID
ncbi:MAG TPA: CoA-binding protein [Anaerolineales bacterium]|nr:CoA-binding protein [Anaerolineales bacterium]